MTNASILKKTLERGQSLWLDNIHRRMLNEGGLNAWIDQGLRGLTSNPSIFNQAISQGAEYDADIVSLKEKGKDAFGIYDELSRADIQAACDAFLPVYEASQGLDGFVSLEIDPRLAHQVEASIEEGRRLAACVDRPNLMIKVPATPEGFPVIEALCCDGISVNVTLIFSLEQYEQAALTYLKAMEKRLASGQSLDSVRSVASVFVSRIDTAVDKILEEKSSSDSAVGELRGRAAVANTTRIYHKFLEIYSSQRAESLLRAGLQRQRPLWGSTSTKNPIYSDVKYVEELIARDTVNTVPEKTLQAFVDHGRLTSGLSGRPEELVEAQALLDRLSQKGIEIDAVCDTLLAEGVKAFVTAFESLLTAIEDKAGRLCESP